MHLHKQTGFPYEHEIKSGRLLVNLVNDTFFETESMEADVHCPNSHFECPVTKYCLPVFLRCNGKHINLNKKRTIRI